MCIWAYMCHYLWSLIAVQNTFLSGAFVNSFSYYMLIDLIYGMKKRFSINSVVNYLEIAYCNKM